MHRRKFLFVVFCLVILPVISRGQHVKEMAEKEWLYSISRNAVNKAAQPNKFPQASPGYALYFMQAGAVKAPYIVCVPAAYNPALPSKLVVFLHGAILARDSFQYKDPAIADEPVFSIADVYNTIVVFPFGRSGFMWPGQVAADENILEIIKQVEQHYNVDKKKIYLGGISMGGIATWWFITNKPDIFAGFYTFSAMPRLASGPVQFSNITKARPLFSMNAKDDPGFSYDEVHAIYEQHENEAPGWHFGSVETGGHRFIYNGNEGKEIVKKLLGNLLEQ